MLPIQHWILSPWAQSGVFHTYFYTNFIKIEFFATRPYLFYIIAQQPGLCQRKLVFMSVKRSRCFPVTITKPLFQVSVVFFLLFFTVCKHVLTFLFPTTKIRVFSNVQ